MNKRQLINGLLCMSLLVMIHPSSASSKDILSGSNIHIDDVPELSINDNLMNDVQDLFDSMETDTFDGDFRYLMTKNINEILDSYPTVHSHSVTYDDVNDYTLKVNVNYWENKKLNTFSMFIRTYE